MDVTQKEQLTEQARDFISQQAMGVIATVSPNNTPEAATVMYMMDHEWNIYVLTHEDSQKVQNIKQNPKVAFVIGTTLVAHTVQIRATAELIDSKHEAFARISQHFASSRQHTLNPIYKVYEKNYVIIKMTVDWLRYLSFDQLTNKEEYVVLIP